MLLISQIGQNLGEIVLKCQNINGVNYEIFQIKTKYNFKVQKSYYLLLKEMRKFNYNENLVRKKKNL